jgi:FixJ family two-component response regulator
LNVEQSIIYLVDDDKRIRESLAAMLTSAGHHVITFESATAYLSFPKPDVPACLILDLQLPGMNGLELQQELASTGGPPVIFLTAQGDISSTVKAMKAGAAEFLLKPFNSAELISAVKSAIRKDREVRSEKIELRSIQKKYQSLTPRERDVLPLVVSGLVNKQTADRLGVSEVTIRLHRAQIMRKMEAGSFADLVRMAARLDIP